MWMEAVGRRSREDGALVLGEKRLGSVSPEIYISHFLHTRNSSLALMIRGSYPFTLQLEIQGNR